MIKVQTSSLERAYLHVNVHLHVDGSRQYHANSHIRTLPLLSLIILSKTEKEKQIEKKKRQNKQTVHSE